MLGMHSLRDATPADPAVACGFGYDVDPKPESPHQSWPLLLSKLRLSIRELGEPPKVADGPDVRIASVVFRLLKEHPDCIDLCDLYLGRHGQQVESLCRQVLLRGPFAHIVEVGAGKGLLGRVLQELMPGSSLTNLEINSGHGGFDRDDAERIVLDVRESSRVLELLQSLTSGRICVVAKHLCGAATDALLQTLASCPVANAILIAPCCHSKIQHLEEYSNSGFLRERGFSASEWPMLIKLLAVARLKFDQDASGSGTASDKSFKSWQRWEHTFGGRKAMIEIGREVRQLLEAGRARILEELGYSTELLQYAPAHTTSENLVIIAEKPTVAVSSPQGLNALPKVGVLLEAPSAAVRVTQFLMEVRGQVLDNTDVLPFLAAFACSDDSVAVIGKDVLEVISALREHALLMVQLRVVTRVYPFSFAVGSLEEVPLKSQGVEPPFRLAVSPRALLDGVLAKATDQGVELSPQHFNASITVRRLWDGSLGVACLPRSVWHPGEEPQSWTLGSDSDGGQEKKLLSSHRLRFRLREWQQRLGVSLRGQRARVHSPQAEWLQALQMEGIVVSGEVDADVLIVDCGRSFQRGFEDFKQCTAQMALAIVPVAEGRGGRAARASQVLVEVSKVVGKIGTRMSAHRDRKSVV